MINNNTKVSKSNPLDFDFGDIGSIPGVTMGDIGMTVSRLPVERIKFTKDHKAMISIITSKVVAVKTHYREGVGNYLCFGGKCCDIDGLAKVKYLFPIVQYDTDKRGKIISKGLEFKVLAIGKDVYDDLLTITDMNGDVTNFDLVATCKDEQYQKISLQIAGNCRWKTSAKLTSEVVAFWKEHMKDIVLPVGRKLSEEELMRAIGTDAITSQGEVNFEDVFNDK